MIGFNSSSLAKKLMDDAVAEQNRRLVVYAQNKIRLIGDMIQMYNSRNHMDRTGNLLDSLCWGLTYRGKLVDSGFYREQRATKLSYLHEWFHDNSEPVGGHVLAANFIKQMSNLSYGGWRLFFAILAPYWGYWEEGFTFKGSRGERFLKFAVMTEFRDVVSNDLKPATVNFRTEAPTYNAVDWQKQAEKRDARAARKGGFSVYDKYSKNGKKKYDY